MKSQFCWESSLNNGDKVQKMNLPWYIIRLGWINREILYSKLQAQEHNTLKPMLRQNKTNKKNPHFCKTLRTHTHSIVSKQIHLRCRPLKSIFQQTRLSNRRILDKNKNKIISITHTSWKLNPKLVTVKDWSWQSKTYNKQPQSIQIPSYRSQWAF